MPDPRRELGDFARIKSKWYRKRGAGVTLDWPQRWGWELLAEKTQEGFDAWAKGKCHAYYDQTPGQEGWCVKVDEDYYFFPKPYPFRNINVLVAEQIEGSQ